MHLRCMRYRWAAPNTFLEPLFVPLALVSHGRLAIVDGVLELHGGLIALLLRRCTPSPGGASAMTLGYVVIGRDGPALAATRASRPGAMTTREMREDMAMKRLITSAGLALLALGLVACESEQANYFKNRVNHISQDAVVRRFGPPHRAHELTTGGTVWAYESRGRADCTVYILRFDQEKVLRDWNERKC